MPPASPVSRCPRCQFAYAWDGEFCDHCHHPYPSRSHWNNFRELARFAASHRDVHDHLLYRFAVGCIRRAWHLLADPDYRQVVLTVERLAEGRANYQDVGYAADRIASDSEVRSSAMTATEMASAEAHEAIRSAVSLATPPFGGRIPDAVFSAARHIRNALALERVPVRHRREFPVPEELEPYRSILAERPFNAREALTLRRNHPSQFQAYTRWLAGLDAVEKERVNAARVEEAVQCDLYRDVVGYPFGPARPDPAEWRTDIVATLADGIHDEHAYDRLPILADALEDAGCDDAEVLEHCRADRPHIRGCWVIELCRSGRP